MKYFWFPAVTLVLDEPVRIDEEPFTLSHYTRSYHVAADSAAHALSLIQAFARTEKATVLSTEPPVEESLSDVPKEKRLQHDVTIPGVLWRTGRAFFAAS